MKKISLLFLILLSGCSSLRKSGSPSGEVDDSIQGRKGNLLDNFQKGENALSRDSLDRGLVSMGPVETSDGKINLKGISHLCAKGNVRQGLKLVRENVKWKPDAPTWTVIGNCYLRHGKYKLAKLHYNQALGIRSNYVPAMNNLAVSETALGNRGVALAFWKKSLKKDAFNRVIRWNLAKFYLNWKLYQKALPHFRSLYKVAPKDNEVSLGLAMTYQGLRNFSQAKTYYLRANAESSSRGDVLVNMALLYDQLGQKQKALRLAKRASNRLGDLKGDERDQAEKTIEFLIKKTEGAQSGPS